MSQEGARIVQGDKHPCAVFLRGYWRLDIIILLLLLWCAISGDQSASTTTDQAQVDARVCEAIDMEDPNIVLDLRSLNTSEAGCYDVFWDECQKFLAEDISPAVDDRRHGHIAHHNKARV